MSASNIEITAFLQSRLAALGLEDVAAVQAARWLDDDALLGDSPSRPGKPLRDLLRAGKIAYAEQRPPTQNGRWFIVKAGSSSQPRTAPTPRLHADATAQPAGVVGCGDVARRRRCTSTEVDRALAALDRDAIKLSAREWPGGLGDLDQPGMYSWWVDPAGAHHLSGGLGHAIAPGRIYAGQTGATKWPSGKRGSGDIGRSNR